MDDIDQREYDASLIGVFYTPCRSYSSTLRDEFTRSCPNIKLNEGIVIDLYNYCKSYAVKLAQYVHIQGKYAYVNKEFKISSSINEDMSLEYFTSVRIEYYEIFIFIYTI